jgi:hypothetical protein
MEYIIVKSRHFEKLEEEIAIKLAENFVPFGSLVADQSDRGYTTYVQPMVKEDEEDNS